MPGWAQIVLGSGITLGSLTAIVLNIVFHHVGRDRGPAVAGTPREGTVGLEEVNRMSREEFVATFGLANSPAQEHAAAIIEIAKIANRRFVDLVAGANPITTARVRALEGRHEHHRVR